MDTLSLILVIAGVIIALIFNFSNGRNIASNAIGTAVATHAISPGKAMILATICCLAGPFIFSTAVAKTIGSGIVNPIYITPVLMLVAAVSAIACVTFYTHIGIPVSATRALVGGLVGAGIAAAGWGSIFWPSASELLGTLYYVIGGAIAGVIIGLIIALILKEPIWKHIGAGAGFCCILAIPVAMIVGIFTGGSIFGILLFVLVSPILGIVISYIFTVILARIVARCAPCSTLKLNTWFKRFQVIGAAALAFTIGGKDGQDGMGIIFAIMVSVSLAGANDGLPMWIVVIAAVSLAAGMLFGGRKIIKNVGTGITKVMPYQGVASSLASSAVLTLTTVFGIPVSTSNAVGGAIIGTGMTRGARQVNWKMSRKMIIAWLVTIPFGALVGWTIYFIIAKIFGM